MPRPGDPTSFAVPTTGLTRSSCTWSSRKFAAAALGSFAVVRRYVSQLPAVRTVPFINAKFPIAH